MVALWTLPAVRQLVVNHTIRFLHLVRDKHNSIHNHAANVYGQIVQRHFVQLRTFSGLLLLWFQKRNPDPCRCWSIQALGPAQLITLPVMSTGGKHSGQTGISQRVRVWAFYEGQRQSQLTQGTFCSCKKHTKQQKTSHPSNPRTVITTSPNVLPRHRSESSVLSPPRVPQSEAQSDLSTRRDFSHTHALTYINTVWHF